MSGPQTVPPRDAWRILADSIRPLPVDVVDLAVACGSWLAAPVVADRDLPPAPRAAMDGFALRAGDVSGSGRRLAVVDEVAAGSSREPQLTPGSCVRIFTGANVPPSADAVVPVEATSSGSFRTDSLDAEIEVRKAVRPGDHIFARGETALAGDVLVPAGTRLGPRQLAVAAAAGRSAVEVHRRPRVVVLNTGEELLEPGQPAGAHRTRNSNGPFLTAAVTAAGLPDVARRTIADAPDSTVAALGAVLGEADAVILTGGISAGRHDYVPGALAQAGVEIAYHGVAVKPGKPQLFGRGPGGSVVFGLPGNPLSCLVGFYEFVLPALRRLAGCPLETCRPMFMLPLGTAWSHEGSRDLVLPARLDHRDQGSVVVPCPPVGSADLVTGGRADGAILLPAACGEIAAGTVVRFRPWTEAAPW